MKKARKWLEVYGKGTFMAWDFRTALGFGVGTFALAFVREVRDAAVPILISEAAIGVAVTATVFAALAVFTTFFDGTYRRVLELAGGFRSALMPYIVIGVVSAASGLSGLIAALALPALGSIAAEVDIAIPTLLCVWTLAGTVSLIDITVFHASARADLMAGADEAESIRAERLSRQAS
jgi:hypothetical protein